MADPKLTAQEFAQKIKVKYPEYKDISDDELTDRMINKYPEYKESVDLTTIKKKSSEQGVSNGVTLSKSGLNSFQTFPASTNKPAVPTVLIGEAKQKAQENFDKNKERVAKSQALVKKKPDGGAGTSFMKGLTSFNESIYKLPQFLYEASTVIPNAIADLTNSPDFQALDYDTIVNATGSQSPLSILRNLGRTEEIKTGIHDSQKEKFEKGVFDSIKEGKYGDAGKQVLNNFAESVPSMAGMMMTGGAGSAIKAGKAVQTIAKTLPFASAKNAELKDNKDIPDYLKPVNAAFNGLSEVIYDQEFGTSAILNDVIQSFTKEGKEIAAKKAKEFVTGYITNAVKKFQPLTSGVKNSIEEMSTQYSQNLVDMLTGESDKDLLEGLADAAIVGGVTGSTIQSVGTIGGLLNSKKKAKLAEVSQRRSEIVDDLDNPNLPEAIKVDLLDQLEKENDKIAKISDEAEATIASLPEKEQKEALQAQEKIEQLEQSLTVENVSEGTKQRIQEQIDTAQDKLDVLVGTSEILAKPDTEATITKEAQQAEQKFKDGGDQVEYEQKINELDDRAQALPKEEKLADLPTISGETVKPVVEQSAQAAEVIPEVSNEASVDNSISEINGYKFTNTPTLTEKDELSVKPLSNAESKFIAENEIFNTKDNSTVKEGVKNEGGGWYSLSDTPYNETFLYNENTGEGVTISHKKGGRTSVAVSDFLKNNPRNAKEKLVLKDKTKDILDDETDEKIGEKVYQDFKLDFNDGAKAFGKVEDGVAYISGINAPKSEEGTVRGTKTYNRVIDKLKEAGIKTIQVGLQSADSRVAIQKLIDNGTLINPRNLTGVSTDQFPTKFDINTNEQQTQTQEEANQDQRPEPTTGSVESGEVTPEKLNFAVSEIQKGAINWDGDRFTPRPNLGIEWKDIRKGIKDIEAGKMTITAKRLIEAINKAKEAGGYKFIQGSGKITREVFVPISEIYETELTAEELDYITANEAQLAQEYDEWFNSLSEEEQLEELNFTEDGIQETQPDTEAESKEDVSDQEDTEGEGEPEGTALKNADIAEKRAEAGFAPFEPVVEKANEQLEADAKQKVKDGFDVPNLIDSILNSKHQATDEEVVILKLYQLAKEDEILNLNNQIVEAIKDGKNTVSENLIAKRDISLEELNNAFLAGKKTGTMSARALQARKVAMLNDYSLAKMLIDYRTSVQGDKLSSEQYNEVVQKYEEIKSLNEKLEADKERLKKELVDALAEKSYKKVVSQTKFEQRKTGRVIEREAIQKDIASTLDSLKKKLKEERKQLNSGISPDMIPEIAKLAQLYAKLGINSIEGVVDRIYTDLKDDFDGLNTDDIKNVLADYDFEAQAREEARLKNFKSRTESKINELRDRINRGDFAKRKIAPIKLDEKALELRDALMKAKYDYEVALLKNELEKRDAVQKTTDLLVDVSGVFRAMQATLDLSAVFRQGFIKTVGGLVSRRPQQVPQMIWEMLKQTVNEKKYNRWLYDLQENPYYDVIKESGLYISDVKNPKITAREEALQSNLVNKVPLLNILTRGSERAYSSFLNMQRVDTFLKAARAMEAQQKTIETHPDDYKELARYVNAATGRGDLGAIESWNDFLSATLFSPRFLASRVRLLTNLANPFWWKDTPMNVKVMYVKDIAKIGIALTAVVGLAQLAGYEVEKDPRSSDFMKLRDGDTRVDLLAGLGQFVVFATRFILGETKDKYGEVTEANRGEIFKRFIRSKLAPVWAIATSLAVGEDFQGDEYTLSNVPREFIPLSLRDVFDNWGNDDELKRSLKFLPMTILGLGVATYKNKSDVSTPDKTIRLNDEVTFKLTEEQLEEREQLNKEFLDQHEDMLREQYSKFNEQHPKEHLKLFEIDRKIKLKANKYSRGQMLRKYRTLSGKYDLEIKK